MSGLQIGLVIAIAFPIVFGAMWCGVVFLLSRVSGWSRLAASFGRDEPPAGGEEFRWQSGSVGVVCYRNCLHIRVSGAGLSLSVALPFRVGHRHLFIPWAMVHDREDTKILWYEATRFEVGRPPLARIRLPRRIFSTVPAP